jgi:hypothetical protein
MTFIKKSLNSSFVFEGSNLSLADHYIGFNFPH